MIRNITVVGAGTMGHGIAHVFSRHGYQVNLYEPFDAVRKSAMDKIRSELQFLADEDYIPQSEVEYAISNIKMFDDLEEAAKDVDYVIEACPEKLQIKQDLFKQLDKICPPGTIFATNTSSLRLFDIIAPLPAKRQAKCLVCHWYNPAYLLPIAELSKFGNMSEEDFVDVYELYVRCGKQPVRVLKDIPGMIANRLLHAQAREAFYLLESGAAEAEDIDRALKAGPCFRNAQAGMLEVVDMGGLDIWLAAEDNLFLHLNNADHASAAMREHVEKGELGFKTGKGFFDYSGKDREKLQTDFYRRLIRQLKVSEER